ncbi:MAG: Fic family protein [Eubacteriales bacterium]
MRDRNSLEAAVNAPLQTFAGFDLFETDLAKIARIGLDSSNHAFLDGNKRIGAMMTQLLLKWNGYVLELKPGELADMFISIAMAVRENTSCKHGSFST